jgi:hypothetical protein
MIVCLFQNQVCERGGVRTGKDFLLAVQQGCSTHEVPTAHHTTHPAFGAYSICTYEGYTAHIQSLITWDDVLSVS